MFLCMFLLQYCYQYHCIKVVLVSVVTAIVTGEVQDFLPQLNYDAEWKDWVRVFLEGENHLRALWKPPPLELKENVFLLNGWMFSTWYIYIHIYFSIYFFLMYIYIIYIYIKYTHHRFLGHHFLCLEKGASPTNKTDIAEHSRKHDTVPDPGRWKFEFT